MRHNPGGTFTDAVLLAGGPKSSRAPRRRPPPWDLATGIGKALRALPDLLPAGANHHDVSLVSVSTPLATNAVVQNRFSPVCTLIIGSYGAMVMRSGLDATRQRRWTKALWRGRWP